jgi:hypothetical protein
LLQVFVPYGFSSNAKYLVSIHVFYDAKGKKILGTIGLGEPRGGDRRLFAFIHRIGSDADLATHFYCNVHIPVKAITPPSLAAAPSALFFA